MMPHESNEELVTHLYHVCLPAAFCVAVPPVIQDKGFDTRVEIWLFAIIIGEPCALRRYKIMRGIGMYRPGIQTT
jgi:hypothetical protein